VYRRKLINDENFPIYNISIQLLFPVTSLATGGFSHRGKKKMWKTEVIASHLILTKLWALRQ